MPIMILWRFISLAPYFGIFRLPEFVLFCFYCSLAIRSNKAFCLTETNLEFIYEEF